MTHQEFNRHVQRIGSGAIQLAATLGINQGLMLAYMKGIEEIPDDVAERIAAQPDYPKRPPKDS